MYVLLESVIADVGKFRVFYDLVTKPLVSLAGIPVTRLPRVTIMCQLLYGNKSSLLCLFSPLLHAQRGTVPFTDLSPCKMQDLLQCIRIASIS